MAYVSKQSVNGSDNLLTALITFLSTNTDLVTANQEWVILDDNTVGAERFVYLKGTGLSELDEIYIGIRSYLDLSTNAYNWGIIGMTGYDSGLSFDLQPGASSQCVLCLSNLSGMEYWIIANGRRFILIVKIGTVYVSSYCGFLLPYATPGEYPYPLYIGATSYLESQLYSDSGLVTSAFWKMGQSKNDSSHATGCLLRLPSGVWLAFTQDRVNPSETTKIGRIWPYFSTDGSAVDYGIGDLDLINTGEYSLLEVILYTKEYDDGNVYGSLEGVFHLPGSGISSEDTVTISLDTYLLIQNIEDVSRNDFAALLLE